MSTNNRRLKLVEFSLTDPDDASGEPLSFECQVSSWKVANNTPDGDKHYAMCPDGEFREDADPDYALELKFYADWNLNGISDFLTRVDGENVDFILDHHPDVVAEHVRWAGTVKVKAPDAGGEARAMDMTEVTLPCIGKPTYSRPSESSS